MHTDKTSIKNTSYVRCVLTPALEAEFLEDLVEHVLVVVAGPECKRIPICQSLSQLSHINISRGLLFGIFTSQERNWNFGFNTSS